MCARVDRVLTALHVISGKVDTEDFVRKHIVFPDRDFVDLSVGHLIQVSSREIPQIEVFLQFSEEALQTKKSESKLASRKRNTYVCCRVLSVFVHEPYNIDPF
jgi:hypothetical protein